MSCVCAADLGLSFGRRRGGGRGCSCPCCCLLLLLLRCLLSPADSRQRGERGEERHVDERSAATVAREGGEERSDAGKAASRAHSTLARSPLLQAAESDSRDNFLNESQQAATSSSTQQLHNSTKIEQRREQGTGRRFRQLSASYIRILARTKASKMKMWKSIKKIDWRRQTWPDILKLIMINLEHSLIF